MEHLREKIFHKRFLPRRTALLRAFTQELHLLVEKCDPAKDPLCLYASSRDTWAVKPPEEYHPCTRPEHYVGVNEKMLEMSLMEWIRFVARWSDAWLLRCAFFRGARLNAEHRAILFDKINSLSTLLEEIERYYASEGIPQSVENMYNMRNLRVIRAMNTKPTKVGEKPTNSGDIKRKVEDEKPNENHIVLEDNPLVLENVMRKIRAIRASKTKSFEVGEKTGNSSDIRRNVESEKPNENHVVLEDNSLVQEKDETNCGKCNRLYKEGQFWILCDACHTWYHGRCVRVSMNKSKDIGLYKCPQCRVKERSMKRKRE